MILHVTNGDAAVPLIRAADPGGLVVPWRDVLHDGPVPGGLADDALADVRARFLAGADGADYDALRRSFRARDEALARATREGRLVLWFEHDLYDQLQLVQVLDRLDPPAPAMIPELVCRAEYLGALDVARGPALFASREPVTPEMIALAHDAWGAFTAPEPDGLGDLAASDTGALPFLGGALLRLLEEYPWTTDGLSRMERQALAAVAGGAGTPREAFAAAQRHEDPVWCGDLSFFAILDRLAGGREPLLERKGDRLAVTPVARAVLAGAADYVKLNGVDRWLGGVRLAGPSSPWRWDPARRALTAAS